jgi:hypothetical protein
VTRRQRPLTQCGEKRRHQAGDLRQRQKLPTLWSSRQYCRQPNESLEQRADGEPRLKLDGVQDVLVAMFEVFNKRFP